MKYQSNSGEWQLTITTRKGRLTPANVVLETLGDNICKMGVPVGESWMIGREVTESSAR